MYNSIVISTVHGPVRGRVVDGVAAFKGIRYGADTGTYRFQPPRPPQPWTDVANAFEFGPTCPQDHPDTGVDRALNPFLQKIGLTDNLPEDEDCLFLNVWTPARLSQEASVSGDGTDGARTDQPDHPGRPVLVWVHSGAYSSNSGSSPSIDGTHLAREHNLVVVTFNHRLGALGYTQVVDPTTEPNSPYAESGNVGMLDIVAMLAWVRDNIAAFGGDPSRITVAGQSGGAMKISILMAMPSAAGLFHRAVLCSGATTLARPLDDALRTGRHLRVCAGLPGDAAVTELAKLPIQDFMRASLAAAGTSMTTFSPVIDGSTLPCAPFAPSALALSAHVPAIIGDLDTEAALFLAGSHDELATQGLDGLHRALTGELGTQVADKFLAALQDSHPSASPYELALRASSDLAFCVHTRTAVQRRVAWAQAHGGAPTWRYRITWRTPVDDGVYMSTHELDVALAFGNVEAARGLNGGGDEARALSRTIGSTWANFAADGEPCGRQGTGSVASWPACESAVAHTLLLTPTPQSAGDVDAAELDAITATVHGEVNWLEAVRAR
ncbi:MULTISPECIES: carboxylesterase/lipase family protein [unclassified Actinomyces]|uniref:carboxylesterase/lipase family protein n=1 Tax=unclassified Actinomyces TaxID=2609248 RepID=UPI00131EF31C|nr:MULTISPECIES: carboxylesterase family protein [unclassified Actinomyces]